MPIKRILTLFLALLTLVSCGVEAVPGGEAGEYLYPTPDGFETLEEPVSAAETAAETLSPGSELPETAPPETEAATEATTLPETEPSETEKPLPDWLPEEGRYYYDLENVVLYLELYGELPPNYIRKDEARELGWEGGSVEDYKDGAAIGGDRFGNREGLLPTKKGRTYTECDIDTDGYYSRGSRRLVFSNDGLYFYTGDHYETFSEVTVTEDYEVIR